MFGRIFIAMACWSVPLIAAAQGAAQPPQTYRSQALSLPGQAPASDRFQFAQPTVSQPALVARLGQVAAQAVASSNRMGGDVISFKEPSPQCRANLFDPACR